MNNTISSQGKWEENKYDPLKILEESKDAYAYVKRYASYYCTSFWWCFFKAHDVASNLMMNQWDLTNLRKNWFIKTYEDICYSWKEKEGYLNLLNKDNFVRITEYNFPEIDFHIEKLITNLGWYKKENIDFLHKLILYKYLNIDDHTIWWVILHGAWGSGKGTLVSLFETIFGTENVLANLWKESLTSAFSTYTGKKLVVELWEIASQNTYADKQTFNKLKNIVGSKTFIVNEKHQKQYETENIALFFITSNSNRPIMLDDSSVWNRRFSVIRSDTPLTNGKEINETIKDKMIVWNYLKWIMETYPDVKNLKKFEALDNQDKRDLENFCQAEANQFWEWLGDNYPDFYGRKRIQEINNFIDTYCLENDVNIYELKKFFWNHSKYPRTKMRIEWRSLWGVEIPQQLKDVGDTPCTDFGLHDIDMPPVEIERQ